MTNYAVSPGEYLAEWLEENQDVSVPTLAWKLGVSLSYVEALLVGDVAVSDPLAHALADLTGIPATSWQAWEGLYQLDRARLEADL